MHSDLKTKKNSQGVTALADQKVSEEPGQTEQLSIDNIAATYRPRIAAYVRKIAKQEDVEDIVQESLEKIVLKKDTFRGDSNFSFWVFRIVSNTTTDYHRRKKETIPGEEFFNTVIDKKSPGPENLIMAKEQTNCIIEKTTALPDKDSIILFLFYFEQLPLSNVAKKLNMTINSAKVQLHRARKKLKSILQDQCALSYNCDGGLSCEQK